MRTTITLTKVDRNLWYCCLTISVKKLCSVKDDSIIFLTCSWQETWYIYQTNDWNVESITETHEACTLSTCIYIKNACISSWLVGYDTYALTIETSKACDDVLCKFWLDFKEFTIVNDCTDDFIHVVSLIRIFWNYLVEKVFFTINRVGTFYTGSCFCVIRWDI